MKKVLGLNLGKKINFKNIKEALIKIANCRDHRYHRDHRDHRDTSASPNPTSQPTTPHLASGPEHPPTEFK